MASAGDDVKPREQEGWCLRSIVRASAAIWPPPDQPRLPLEETAINTVALFLSGLLLIGAQN
jgi:heme/copper-type cytochrome/quinol oxidase subunit 3